MRSIGSNWIWGIVAFGALAGCGGSSDDESTASPLTIAASSDYNGLTTPLTSATSTSSDAGGRTTIQTTSEGRTLVITLPSTLAAGTYDLAGGTTAVRYTEPTRAGGGTWVTEAGTLTITAAGTDKWDLKLTNASFVVDGSIESNPATGSFTMSGTAAGVPYKITGGTGGDGTFTFSDNTSGVNLGFTPNYTIKSVANGLVSAVTVELVNGTTKGGLTVSAADADGTYDIGDTLVSSTVTNGPAETAKSWSASSGRIQVTKSGDKHTFRLIDVVYAADEETGATGSFKVNGSFSK